MTRGEPDERRPGADDETRTWPDGSQPSASPGGAPPGPPAGSPPPSPPDSAPPGPPAPPASLPPPASPNPSGAPGSGGWGPASWSAGTAAAPAVERGVPGAPGLEYAGVAPRLVAFIIDGLVLAMLSAIIAVPMGVMFARLGAGAIVGPILIVIIDAVYFAGLWSSEWRATLGMRLFRMQIGNAMDGRRLSGGQAFRRWIVFGTWVPAVVIDPYLGGLASLLLFGWWVLLLITTGSSPTRQGLHDRFAETAIVRPAGSGGLGLVMGCILVVVILALVSIAAIVALILLGSQVSAILSSVGDSI